MPFVVIDLPTQYLPPDAAQTILDLRTEFWGEIINFFTVAVPIVIAVLVLKSWSRTQ